MKEIFNMKDKNIFYRKYKILIIFLNFVQNIISCRRKLDSEFGGFEPCV